MRTEQVDAPADGVGTAWMARGLGVASVGLGLAELVATREVQNVLGLADRPRHRGVLRVLGVREVVQGIGILTAPRSARLTRAVWVRVAGDVLDAVLLGVAATRTRRPRSLGLTIGMVAVVAAADLAVGILLKRRLPAEG